MTAPMDLPVSVIICAYTEARWTDLRAAIAALRTQQVPPHEMIVVVDHNPALFERASAELALEGARVLANTGPRGLSGARNAGVAHARGAILAFLDDDAIPEPDWLARLLEAYRDPRVIAAGGAIEPLWPAGRPRWFPEEFDWVVGCTYRGVPTAPTPVQRLIGCNMSFRREAFDLAGSFRSEIGQVGDDLMRSDDTEFTIRLWQRCGDRVLLFVPQARVRHRVTEGRASWAYFRSRCYAEGFSKAQMARLVGSRDGLAAERDYVARTLPAGVARGLAESVTGRDAAGIRRSGAILAGLAITGFGYVSGALVGRLDAQRRQGLAQYLLPRGAR